MSWWVSEAWQTSPMLLVSWVFWVIFSICLHELSHGYAAIRLGDDTPIHTGHMTWNPMVHMGPWALLMFALFGFTWGLMPINPSRLRHRYGEAIVAFAGPLCNLLLFAGVMLGLILWTRYGVGSVDEKLARNLYIFLRIGAVINLLGFIFNLVPVPPLDGSRILGDFFPKFAELWRGEQGAMIGMVAFMAIFFVGSRHIWGIVFRTTDSVLRAGVDLLG